MMLSEPPGYRSNSQRARVATEMWVATNLYCPACESPRLLPTRTGSIVTDFACPVCSENFQLKSKRGVVGTKIIDAAYSEALLAAQRNEFPHLLLLGYKGIPGPILTLQAIPGTFITPQALEQRKPLSPVARRAGWIGCNIIIGDLPESARIVMVEGGRLRPIEHVRREWRRFNFLEQENLAARTWFNEILKRVERLGQQEFELEDVYAFERDLARVFPRNRFIRPKIRQQLQVLRDRGLLEFLGRGRYRYLEFRASGALFEKKR